MTASWPETEVADPQTMAYRMFDGGLVIMVRRRLRAEVQRTSDGVSVELGPTRR